MIFKQNNNHKTRERTSDLTQKNLSWAYLCGCVATEGLILYIHPGPCFSSSSWSWFPWRMIIFYVNRSLTHPRSGPLNPLSLYLLSSNKFFVDIFLGRLKKLLEGGIGVDGDRMNCCCCCWSSALKFTSSHRRFPPLMAAVAECDEGDSFTCIASREIINSVKASL